MEKRRYIRRMLRMAALAVGMVLTGGASAWGQQRPNYSSYSITPQLDPNRGQSEEVLYLQAGTAKTVTLQEAGAENLDGYIRWYIVDEDNPDGTTEGLSRTSGTDLDQYANGWVWLRGQVWDNDSRSWVDEASPAGACSIDVELSANDLDGSKVLVCEATSLNNPARTGTGQYGSGWQTQSFTYIIESPLVTFQRRYILRDADDDENTLSRLKNALESASSYDNWYSSASEFRALAALSDEQRRNYFLESYELHTPLSQGTNYRLSRQISNYYLPSSSYNPANCVRWNVFNEKGTRIDDYRNYENYSANSNIWQHTFGADEGIDSNSTDVQVLYLVAEVANAQIRDGNIQNIRSDYYPVAFIKLYLDPYSEPLTQSQLDSYESNKDSHYYSRTDEYLDEYNYKEVASITFDENPSTLAQVQQNPALNYSDEPMQGAESYYAYGYPNQFMNRKNNRFSVGRGEYALFRTLNYNDISEGYITINGSRGEYNDYFADYYNKYVLDRLYERSDGSQLGYFLYLDASDAPGTITNITLPSDLCPDTRLVVSAWICDLAHSADATNADVSFIFKGVKGNEETILNRYQSGIVPRNPSTSSQTKGQANWQQIYFSFTFQDTQEGFDSYVLEIANNTPNSNGADYAIDDIRCWRSTPNIEVIREDACDASTLTISSDYETLLNNMDWTAGQDISDIQEVYDNAELIKYRFGLQGTVGASGYPNIEWKVGNTYFSFLEGLEENANGNWVVGSKIDATGTNESEKLTDGTYRWIRINKNLQVSAPAQSRYSLRVVVSTDRSALKGTYDAAQEEERRLNFRALLDYNYAVTNWDDLWNDVENVPEKPAWLNQGEITVPDGLTENNINDEENLSTYASLMQELYGRLEIPRIRVPWISGNTLYLSRVDVASTDLRYVGEILGYDEQGNSITADGQYQVILFDALQIEDGVASKLGFLNNECNLISGFPVRRPVRITVETEPGVEGMICAGTQRQIKADLINVETDEPLEEQYYGFDWFLGTENEYNALTASGVFGTNVNLKTAIDTYRRENSDTDEITWDEINGWSSNMKQGLLDVYNDLRTDVKDFTIILDVDTIIAMPFIKQQFDDDALYCTNYTPVPFDAISDDVPEVYPGIVGVNYPASLTTTPVRLGLRHINNTTTELRIPLRSDIAYSVEDNDNTNHELREIDNRAIFWEDVAGTYPDVAEVVDLYAKDGGENNYLVLKFNDNAKNSLKAEGQEYVLRVPFGEYASSTATSSLGATCDGLAELHIKIVPEYLTWQDGGTNWYNESATNGGWKQSTKEQLYMGDETATDANGDDDVNAFTYSPLYFTKITIPENAELQLENLTADANGTLPESVSDIRYDMAVNTNANGDLTITPYYINKVDQIYFKPNATLYRQDYLTYNKAWVDFEMTEGTPYWMASPLKDVYAGDMYAPKADGQEDHEAFSDITYNEVAGTNGRWDLPFYQKAWDKAITYYTNEAGTEFVPVDAVVNNWSIEYNDVNVPYSLGKGFYSRVENNNALVRLPKADESYNYEGVTTRAIAAGRTEGADYAQLADATLEIDLSKEDAEDEMVDGNGTYFLIGNPYMAYLKMDGDGGFLTSNTNLEEKFWTLSREDRSVVAGTPDVTWENANSGTSGYVAPMTAFFVQLKDGTDDKTITFSTSMTVAKPVDAEDIYTRAYEASNPQLTLTASSANGKSRAAIVQRSDASNQYESDKDAVTLLDSELDAPTVYTVAGNYAAAVNAIHDYKNVPLGVYADADEEVELTIEGASQLVESLYLYDAVTRSTTPIEGDSYTLNLQGSSHGRYFLTTDEGITVESDIRIYSPADGQLIIASTPSDKLKHVQVYDLSGRVVDSRQNIGMTTCQISVPGGIYIIRAESEHGEAQAKLKVR